LLAVSLTIFGGPTVVTSASAQAIAKPGDLLPLKYPVDAPALGDPDTPHRGLAVPATRPRAEPNAVSAQSIGAHSLRTNPPAFRTLADMLGLQYWARLIGLGSLDARAR